MAASPTCTPSDTLFRGATRRCDLRLFQIDLSGRYRVESDSSRPGDVQLGGIAVDITLLASVWTTHSRTPEMICRRCERWTR